MKLAQAATRRQSSRLDAVEELRATHRFARVAGVGLLGALAIDLAATKWGSYLPSPVSGLYLPDFLFLASAMLSAFAMVCGYRTRATMSAIVASSGCIVYLACRVIGALDHRPISWELWIRDLAPFAYIALIPLLAAAASTVTFRALVTTVRIASTALALSVAASVSGILQPISIGTEIPAFSSRPDAENVVFGLGVIAFGKWGLEAKPRRAAQVLLISLAAVNYSRAGLLAAILCMLIAAVREREALLASRIVPIGLIGLGLTGLVILLVPRAVDIAEAIRPAEALVRLVGSDVDTGTTEARVRAWERVITYTRIRHDLLLGSGPGTQPIADSGALAYLSGIETVRAPHNWPVGAIAYHGALGLLAWAAAYGRALGSARATAGGTLAATGILAYTAAGLFGVVVESPFGSLPMATFAVWLLCRNGDSVMAADVREEAGADVDADRTLTTSRLRP